MLSLRSADGEDRVLIDEHGRGARADESGAHGGFGRDASELHRAMGGVPRAMLGEAYTGPIQAAFSP
jgi:hypothetical protein